ncbi:hypothetical protein YEEN111655_08150 [Yersinia entomophaga]
MRKIIFLIGLVVVVLSSYVLRYMPLYLVFMLFICLIIYGAGIYLNPRLTTSNWHLGQKCQINGATAVSLSVLFLILVTCSSTIGWAYYMSTKPWYQEDSNGYQTHTLSTTSRKIAQVHNAVLKKVKHPERAEFLGDYISPSEGLGVICGYLNYQDPAGEDDDYYRYVSNGTPSGTFLQLQTESFSAVWTQFCLDKN